MAQKRDIAAEKARKQKIVLAIAGVALVGLAVIQVPKLMKGESQPAAAPAAESTSTPGAASADPAAPATTTAPAAAVTPSVTTSAFATKPAAFVAGVGLPGTRLAPAAKTQLASFTLFQPSDPFVQQVGEETGATAESAAPAAQPAPEAPAAEGPTATQGGSTPAGGAAPAAQAQQPAVAYATVMFNGNPEQLEVKGKFPANDPIFVLVSLKKKQAKIGVAGGSFDGSETITLPLGRALTLVNTATGVRHVLKLVYTGTAPEVIEGFSTKADQQPDASADGSTVSAAPTATATP